MVDHTKFIQKSLTSNAVNPHASDYGHGTTTKSPGQNYLIYNPKNVTYEYNIASAITHHNIISMENLRRVLLNIAWIV